MESARKDQAPESKSLRRYDLLKHEFNEIVQLINNAFKAKHPKIGNEPEMEALVDFSTKVRILERLSAFNKNLANAYFKAALEVKKEEELKARKGKEEQKIIAQTVEQSQAMVSGDELIPFYELFMSDKEVINLAHENNIINFFSLMGKVDAEIDSAVTYFLLTTRAVVSKKTENREQGQKEKLQQEFNDNVIDVLRKQTVQENDLSAQKSIIETPQAAALNYFYDKFATPTGSCAQLSKNYLKIIRDALEIGDKKAATLHFMQFGEYLRRIYPRENNQEIISVMKDLAKAGRFYLSDKAHEMMLTIKAEIEGLQQSRKLKPFLLGTDAFQELEAPLKGQNLERHLEIKGSNSDENIEAFIYNELLPGAKIRAKLEVEIRSMKDEYIELNKHYIEACYPLRERDLAMKQVREKADMLAATMRQSSDDYFKNFSQPNPDKIAEIFVQYNKACLLSYNNYLDNRISAGKDFAVPKSQNIFVGPVEENKVPIGLLAGKRVLVNHLQKILDYKDVSASEILKSFYAVFGKKEKHIIAERHSRKAVLKALACVTGIGLMATVIFAPLGYLMIKKYQPHKTSHGGLFARSAQASKKSNAVINRLLKKSSLKK